MNIRPTVKGFALATVLMPLLAGCQSTSDRIAHELIRKGIDARQSRCMGDQLSANLTVGQLRQLGRAARAYEMTGKAPEGLTVGDLVQIASQFDDPRVPLVVGLATVACGLVAMPT